MWNGAVRKTTYVSGTQLTAAIGAADIAKEKTNLVTVANPALNPNVGGPAVCGDESNVGGGDLQRLDRRGSRQQRQSRVDLNRHRLCYELGGRMKSLEPGDDLREPVADTAVITASNYNSLAANVTVKNPAGTSPALSCDEECGGTVPQGATRPLSLATRKPLLDLRSS